MQFLYKDLKMKNIRTSSVEDIVTYYKINYNGGFLPPERDVNGIGYKYLQIDAKKALPYFKLNVKNYRTSSNAFDSLGEAYMHLGDKKNAIKNYKESLKLDATNVNAKKMIQKLQKK
jgi:tetratricopeptide (TPR) repeat protein